MAITPRLRTTELLYKCAQKMGLRPVWVMPGGLFVISIDGEEKYINFARSPLNSHASASLAKDKYLTRLILERHNMQNIPFARPQTQDAAAEFLRTHGKIIAKPVNGSGARDIHIITEAKQLQTLQISGYILEKYIGGKELRYLVLNDTVIGMYQSKYGTSVDVKRALQCVSYPRTLWDPALVSSSVQIAHALDLKFAAVDYMQTSSGTAYILEVNTTPDLKWFHAPTSGPIIDIARMFLEAIVASSRPPAVQIETAPLGTAQVAAYS